MSEEGELAAQWVAELLQDVEVHHIASSPYTRAVRTVQYAAEQRGLQIEEYEELIERPIKGLDYKAPWSVLEEAIRQSFTDKTFALEGGESTRQAQKRAIPVIEKLLQERSGQTILIGTHGNIMTIIMNYYDERYGYEFWLSTSKPDIYRLTFEGSRLLQVDRVWQEK